MTDLVLIIAILANPTIVFLAYYFFEKKERFYIQALLSKDAGELKMLQTEPNATTSSLPPLPDLSPESAMDDDEFYKLIKENNGKPI